MDIPYAVEARPDTGLFNAKLGIWLFLASETMLFGALFSSYVLLRVGAPEWGTLRVFDASPKDGSPIDIREYPVRLTPGG